jgi:hypothetical protein
MKAPNVKSGQRRLLTSFLTLMLLGAGAAALAEETPIASKWQVQEINYSYTAFTTAYDCDAAADKIEAILKTLGAHPNTKARASGCPGSRPSRNFFVTITTAVPVPAADIKAPTDADKSREELLKRLGVKSDIGTDEFPAGWQSIELSKERRLDIRSGDCELLEGLSKRVLPKLGMKIEEERVTCMPNQVSLQPPQLKVSALVPLKSPDAKASEKTG